MQWGFMKKFLTLLMSLLLAGCGSNKIAVTNQQLTPEYLASSYVGSPDPSLEHFTTGVQIALHWNVTSPTKKMHPKLILDVIFGDLTEQRFEYKITKSSGYQTIRLFEPVFSEKKGILTYKAEIIVDDGEVVAEWKHQLWTPLLHIQGETI